MSGNFVVVVKREKSCEAEFVLLHIGVTLQHSRCIGKQYSGKYSTSDIKNEVLYIDDGCIERGNGG